MQIAAQIVVVVAIFAVIQMLLIRYRRCRQKTADGQAWISYKAQMPQWLKTIERLIALAFWFGISFGLFFVWLAIRSKIHPGNPSPFAVCIAILAVLSLANIPAFLLANVVSWLIPALHKANLQALEGTSVSLGSANAGLLKAGAIVTPVAMAAIALVTWLP